MARSAERFVAAHRVAWQRLNELVDKAQRTGLTALSDDELHELGALYRRAAADLARAQTRYASTTAGRELVRSLNDLVLRAHVQVYSAPAPQPVRALHFLLYGFPAAFRRQWRAILLAAVLFYGPGVLSYCAVVVNPSLSTLFVDEHVIKEVQKRAQKKITVGWGGHTEFEGLLSSPAISSFIMTNNIRVTIMAVALGVTMGLGTALLLIQNGLLLGGLSGVATNERVDLLFWAVILPHGILELSAIAIAGGAGFLLARALYAPGDLPRRDAIMIAGGEAARLIVGVALLLVIAGLIEGFITPQPFDPLLKIAFALLTGVGLILYLNHRPRERRIR
ncbi:MAG: stage II sporulation protein M [Armatimonadota bacterium]|nr:stage II sporulation protein M [Armatimonadota bacterium]